MHHFYKNLSSSLPIKKSRTTKSQQGDKMGWTGMFNLPFFAGWAKNLSSLYYVGPSHLIRLKNEGRPS
jgi:hypothetical protein